MSKYGLKETKEVLDLVFAGVGAYNNAMLDGKLGLEDLGHLMPLLMVAPEAIKDITKVPSELKDLDVAEAADLLLYMKKYVDPLVSDPELQNKIDKGLKLALSLVEFLFTFKKSTP